MSPMVRAWLFAGAVALAASVLVGCAAVDLTACLINVCN
jgi:hypothetical protein